jgi:hypothetical protein
MLPDPSKRCNYCQGPVCIYGGQLEHDLARKLESSDVDESANRLYPSA